MIRRATFLAATTVALVLSSSCSRSTPPAEDPGSRTAAANEAPSPMPVIAEATSEISDAELLDLLADEQGEVRHKTPPLEGPISMRGSTTAPVELVLYFDYQCPYSQRLNTLLNELLVEYDGRLRVRYRHFPLPMHKQADELARASLAGAKIGAFDAVHDELFTIARREDHLTALTELAMRAGLDAPSFTAEAKGSDSERRLNEHLIAGRELGVRSTPTWFINGKAGRGAIEREHLVELLDTELARVEPVIAAGVPPGRVPSRIDAVASDEGLPKPAPSSTKRAGRPDPDAYYAVPTDGRPVRGAPDALVTIIEWADYQCPFSRRAEPTLEALLRRYPTEIRIVHRHNPLPMHSQAPLAARAAWAAGQQGKFFEMHELLFSDPKAISEAKVDAWAKTLGLDLQRFRQDRNSAAAHQAIETDQEVGKRFGARGTPAFFINGRFLSGAQPESAFVKLIEEELPRAQSMDRVRGGTPGLYEALIADGKTKVEAPPPKPVADEQRRVVDTTGLPRRGSAGAPVQILMCGDFDCPYCARSVAILDELERRYPGKLAIFFQHRPLPFHTGAEEAARFAWAAHRQGLFWEAWRALYAGQSSRSGGPKAARQHFRTIAKNEGMSWSAIEADMQSSAATRAVSAGDAQCEALGARGTPTFFVNGRKVSGAQPPDKFAGVIDEELGRP